MGDAVQFTIVLRHLRQQYPEAHITLETKEGRGAIFRHLVDDLQPLRYPFDTWANDISRYVTFGHFDGQPLPYQPTSKVTQCLLKEFGITPQLDLYRYSVSIRPEVLDEVIAWREGLGPQPVVMFHYEGVSCPAKKNLPRPVAADLCQRWAAAGVTPIILDWGLNKVANGRTIFTPSHLPQDSDYMAALIAVADLFVGVDSGPAHVAAATDTPALVLWHGFYPAHNFDPCGDTWHCLTAEAEGLYRNGWERDFFQDHYRHDVYNDIPDMAEALAIDVPAMLLG